MRIQFSDVFPGREREALTPETIESALAAEQTAGRIAPHVTFKVLRGIRSSTGRPALEVQLQAAERDRGRRFGAAGAYANTNEWAANVKNYAATFDEWGWLLAALYRLDSGILVGSPSAPVYNGASDFQFRTGMTYRANLAEVIERDGDPFPFRVSRSLVGARGRGRSGYAAASWGTRDERTADWARAFRAGEVF